MSFLGEIKRRKVFQVAAVYLVVSWLIMQVVDVVDEPLNLPDWFDTAVIVALAVGLPIALILAWAFDLTPDGVVRDHGSAVATQTSGRRIEYVLIGLLVVAVSWLVYRDIGESGGLAARDDDVLPNSVAVLPFDNLSPDPDNAYFAAGIHEEILNQLAKLRNLSVISRTSVLRYADSGLSIPEIANELNVETVMEGSVRYAGDRVRIAAQLIDAATDEHLWSDVYEREFTDIFAIQADIAMNIANALDAEFTQAERSRIERIPTESLDAYAFYLRALSVEPKTAPIYLDQALALDPEFARAYAMKAQLLSFSLVGVAGSSPAEAAELERTARESANEALALDPALGLAHAALGGIYMVNWRGTAAEQAFQRAYELNPADAAVLAAYGRFKRYRGEYAEAIPLLRRAVELDPENYLRHTQLGIAYSRLRNYDASATSLRRCVELISASAGCLVNLALAEIAQGNPDDALRRLQVAEALTTVGFRLAQLADAYAQMGNHEQAARFFSVFEDAARETPVSDAVWVMAYLAVGDDERALERLESAVNNRVLTDFAPLTMLQSNPWDNPVLNRPEFRKLLTGLWSE